MPWDVQMGKIKGQMGSKIFQSSGNPYFDIVSRISPNELIGRFADVAPRHVQEAAKLTIVELIGKLQDFALETTILTTTEKLGSLCFQLQMTGYMLKNAEYRISLAESLQAIPVTLPSRNETMKEPVFVSKTLASTPVSGKISLHVKDGSTMEVDAADYVSELKHEVSALQQMLAESKLETENAKKGKKADGKGGRKKGSDLLQYIRSMPEAQMSALTDNISEDVLEAMKKLANAVVEGQTGPSNSGAGQAILQQTGTAMVQLCMWQLAVGYNLRELEVRNDLRDSMSRFKR
mmetsp:Transcript_52973/g.103620  ORF Transcript_52973/g.103620 Transcript_52973/m.103620 type:complete len:292 (-) Transcript_52973:441-1316(-)